MREYMRRRRLQPPVQELALAHDDVRIPDAASSNSSASGQGSSASSSSGDEEDAVRRFTLCEKLRVWKASNMGVTQSALTQLLQIVRGEGHDVPVVARTLMDTPRHVPVTDCENGQYHIRSVRYVLDVLWERMLGLVPGATSLPLQLSSDGVSIFSSSTKEFYPVMLKVNDPRSPPILYALHFGKRPHPNFYRACLESLLPFLTLGWDREDKKIDVVLEAVVADLPARQQMKQIRSHAAYSACEYCLVQTDAEFCLKSDPMHHLPESTSPFVEVRFI